MNEAPAPRPAAIYWVLALAGLAWNAWGCWLFWLTVTRDPAAMAQQSPAFADWLDGFPDWVTAVYLAGVGLSLLGSLLMLERSRWSPTAFLGSLLGALASYGYQFTHLLPGLGAGSMAVVAAVVVLAIVLQWAYVRSAARKGWLR